MSWSTEVIGSTLRVIDEEGNDVCRLGDCHSETHQRNAKLIAAAPELLRCLKTFTVGTYWITDKEFELARNLVARLGA